MSVLDSLVDKVIRSSVKKTKTSSPGSSLYLEKDPGNEVKASLQSAKRYGVTTSTTGLIGSFRLDYE